MVHVATERDGSGGSGVGEPLSVDLRLRTEAIEVAITNRGETPVDVLWDKASLVDTQGKASAVVRSSTGDQWAAPDVSGDVSRIPPHGTLHVFIIPARSVSFERESGWIVDQVLPVECGPLRCTGYHELVGKTVSLRLPMQVNGVEQNFEWTLRITDAVKSFRGGRPQEPSLP